jgi:hypothetical protein
MIYYSNIILDLMSCIQNFGGTPEGKRPDVDIDGKIILKCLRKYDERVWTRSMRFRGTGGGLL